MKLKLKRGIVTEYIPWLLLGIAVLTIVMIVIFVLREKGVSLIEQIKSLFGS